MKRLTILVVIGALGMSACSFVRVTGTTYHAEFSRAVQVFPGIKVRVLGVDVGTVTNIANVDNGVEVTFRLDDKTMKLPADVQAAIVPMSLLGERYIQLFPSYQSGPTLAPDATIPLNRTAVPAEPDELLRSLQDYLGALDSDALTKFVENAAEILQGNGDDLNRLIQGAAGVVGTLADKRDDLADLIVQLNKLTLAIGSRQQEVGQLIDSYNTVAATLTGNRSALEGTVSGLNAAALELASLLIEHRSALNTDIDTLTLTGRTLDRNVNRLVDTTHWAADLFAGASRAVDTSHDWLRLNNQGEPLGMLILTRLQERLVELCQDLGVPSCSTSAYWAAKVPSLFCFQAPCAEAKGSGAEQLAAALNGIPQVKQQVDQQNGGTGSTDGAVDDLLHKLPGVGGGG
ncbi:MAG TPA: MCE family protein [Actinomycetota bacterium]|nr:MCE family protein [Actinomycetota bacterium]